MILLPAIDLRGGKCVRLLQGRDEAVTVYGDDPSAVALEWVRQGASWLHVVNLDGAFGRASGNLEMLGRIASGSGARVEFGGGLRTLEDMQAALDAGAQKLVLGTAAFAGGGLLAEALRRFGAGRMVVAVDAKDGLVTTEGWTAQTGLEVVEAAQELETRGVREVLYTDVARDGMLTGPDTGTLERLVRSTGLSVIASGGVASLDDLRLLAGARLRRLSAVVVGKALYEREFTLREAMTLGFQ